MDVPLNDNLEGYNPKYLKVIAAYISLYPFITYLKNKISGNDNYFTTIESYERYRTIYFNEEIEISIDEYPFGIALEIENKSNNKNPKDIVKKYLTILNNNYFSCHPTALRVVRCYFI